MRPVCWGRAPSRASFCPGQQKLLFACVKTRLRAAAPGANGSPRAAAQHPRPLSTAQQRPATPGAACAAPKESPSSTGVRNPGGGSLFFFFLSPPSFSLLFDLFFYVFLGSSGPRVAVSGRGDVGYRDGTCCEFLCSFLPHRWGDRDGTPRPRWWMRTWCERAQQTDALPPVGLPSLTKDAVESRNC